MYYTDNTDWDTYNNNSFVPVFIDNIANWVWPSAEFEQAAKDLCGDDTACLYDSFVFKDLSVGESGKKIAEDGAKASSSLSKLLSIDRKDA